MALTPVDTHTTRPTLRGSFGMSASTHWLATASAQAVLERGGNAFDAAVAAGFVLHIVEPHLNGPGGDLVGIFSTADAPGQPVVMMGQGPAPAAASAERYRAEGLVRVPGSGALAAAVPAAVDSWLQLLRDHGTWELADVLDYALHYAEHGHQIVPAVASAIADVAELFRSYWPSSAEQWLVDGQPPEPFSTQTNKPYASVLRKLIAAGESAGGSGEEARRARIEAARTEWRTGFVAQAIGAFAATPHLHSDGREHAGVITAADIAACEAGYESPRTAVFRGWTVAKSDAWGQGPVLLLALRILDGFPDKQLDPATAEGIHTIVEALKLALADRDVHFGDAAVDLDYLLSDEYIAARRALITETASTEFRPGHVPGAANRVPPLLTVQQWQDDAEPREAKGIKEIFGVGEPTLGRTVPPAAGVDERDAADDSAAADSATADATADAASPSTAGHTDSPANPADAGHPDTFDGQADATGVARGDTCHLDIIDRWGNAIAVTPSGGWLQSSPSIPQLGFNLGTRLQMAWLDDGLPSTLTPGRRPRTTLTPTLLMRDGQTRAVLGTPGGDQQDQWQLLAVLRMIVGGFDAQAIIDAPHFHTTSMPASFYPRTWTPAGLVVEDRVGDDVIAELERRGHAVTRAGEWKLGRVSIVTRDPQTGELTAGANSRGQQGYAAGR